MAGTRPRSETAPGGDPLRKPLLHESGLRHTTGEALYVDDLPEPPNLAFAYLVTSPHAHARILRRSGARAVEAPGVYGVFFAEDIPGENQVGPVVHDEPLLARDVVECVGQVVALVVAESVAAARRAASWVEVEYEPLPAILDIPAGIAAGSYLSEPHVIERGDVEAALASAAVRFDGEVQSGAQDHFYLETQCALAIPEEAGAYRVFSSTQHPSEVQAKVAEVLGIGRHLVAVEVPRLGGGFGGKETQGASFAALAALGAARTRRPVKVTLDRDRDMMITGKRHPFVTRYRAGFDARGMLIALDARLWSNGGFSNDLSRAIMDRALFHTAHAYFIPNVRFEGRVVKTHLPSNTAFRGFGGPQGALVVESVLDSYAERLGLDPAVIRVQNAYGDAPRDVTPYGQPVVENRLPRIFDSLLASSDYFARRAAIEAHNRASGETRRGIGLVPVQFGISFTTSFLNQAGALVVMFADGTVQMNHGGTEMGQGLQTKMLAVVAHTLGVRLDAVRAMPTSTEKVPNTSATAASSGADLNGQALKIAAESIRERLRPIAARMLGATPDEARLLRFAEGRVQVEGAPARAVSIAEVAAQAYLAQVSLSATGYYRTPDIHYDRVRGRGRPFYYFAFGAAVSEVEVSGLTGEHRLTRVDILHDVGNSLVPSIDLGQIEGGFMQGVGWLTSEEVVFDARGHLRTHSPDTYKIPSCGDAPEVFEVRLLEDASHEPVVYGSKAVGEPPLLLAFSVLVALRHAISGFAPTAQEVVLGLPATPESILRAIDQVRRR